MIKYIIFGVISFFFLLIFIFILTHSRDKKDAETAKKGKPDKTTAELINIIGYDFENHCFVMKGNRFMDLLQITTKDLINSSKDEVEYDSMKFAKLYKLYEDDMKLIAMNFPCDTKQQQSYVHNRIAQTANPMYKSALQKDLEDLIWLEKHDTTREFYLMIFARSLEMIEKNRRTIKTVLHTGRDGLIEEISDQKKEDILIRMNNKNLLMYTA